MRVRVLIEMDDGGVGIRAVNVLDAAMRTYNEKLSRAVPEAAIDFEVLGVVAEEPEWEYGVEMPLHTGTVVVASRDEATARAEAWLYPLHRRRKAGPWVPVDAGDGS